MARTGEFRGVLRSALRGLFLCVPVVALLSLPVYARVTPTLAGFPFFYWYQILLVPVCSLSLLGAYLVGHRSPATRSFRDQR